jgi:hypothetical protein
MLEEVSRRRRSGQSLQGLGFLIREMMMIRTQSGVARPAPFFVKGKAVECAERQGRLDSP